MNVWEALAGRAPDEPTGPADLGLWGAVVDRLNPARARPALRAGVEAVRLTGVRGDYVMVRSPDDGTRAGHLRLTPQEWQLALLMDGRRPVARLVADFARIAGRLAPDQVSRVVADLAGNRMLDELPVDAFRPLLEARRRPLPGRPGNALVTAARGRRVLVLDVDGALTSLYRAAGPFLFGRAAAVVAGVLAVTGLALFVATWVRGSQSLFLVGGSYLAGAVVLLALHAIVSLVHGVSRALAARHAGREVPAAGLLVTFGVPSFFVDTSDVWLASRRTRLLVSASGPLGILLFGGVVQFFGLALPALGGVAFKLTFLCCLAVFFQLSPLLPMDGQRLLMDWLEIPQLPERAVAWAGGRLRGRPPRWPALDREGRLIALSGILAVTWLAVAACLAYRVWTDRIAGLATGLAPAGLLGGLLLVLIVLGLGGPAVSVAIGRLGHAWQRFRQRRVERHPEADAPRRMAALRASELGGLSEQAVRRLAAPARWVRPPTGGLLVPAGDPPSTVYVVVAGSLQARGSGDPTATIRHRVGPGGVVGLVDALTGRPAELDWFPVGATLIAIPAATVATVIGPLPGPPAEDRAEAEALFAETPALAALALDQRLALIASAHPIDLDAGAPVLLPGPVHAVVVESGVIAMPDGLELRRGTLVGPVGDGTPGMVARARTPVRLWVMPDASAIPPLVGDMHRPGSPMPVGSLGADPWAPRADEPVYPPLAVPPGPPEGPDDPELDRRFAGRLRWLVVLLLVVALVLTGLSFRTGPAWAEMPADRVLLSVEEGEVDAVQDGQAAGLVSGDRRYVGAGSRVDVPVGAAARLTFSGGAGAVLCGGSRLELSRLYTDAGRRRSPAAGLTLESGRVLVDTAGTSGAYDALSLTVDRVQNTVTNAGAARYAVEPTVLTVVAGQVTAGSFPAPVSGGELSCDTGGPAAPLSTGGERTPPAPASVPPSTAPSVAPSTRPTVDLPLPTQAPDPGATREPPTPTQASPTAPATTWPATQPMTTQPPAATTTPTTPTPTITSSPTVTPTSPSATPPDATSSPTVTPSAA